MIRVKDGVEELKAGLKEQKEFLYKEMAVSVIHIVLVLDFSWGDLFKGKGVFREKRVDVVKE